MKSNTLSIYGCGGCGANVVQRLINLPVDAEKPLYPISRRYVVDTSESNISNLPDDIKAFLIPGVDGAGKQRAFAYHAAADKVNKILQDNKPSEFNLVIFSASGGSGSVLGPLLVQELQNRDAVTMCIVIGSTLSHIECHNTVKTLETLQGIAQSGSAGNQSIAMMYFENSDGKNSTKSYVRARPEVDELIEGAIRQVGLLVGGSHHGLDESDLRNLLGFSGHTGIPPQLTEMRVFRKGEDGIVNGREKIESLDGQIQALCSLMNDDKTPQPSLSQPYSCDGYYTVETVDLPDLHYALSGARLQIIFGALNTHLDELNDVKEQLSSNTGAISVAPGNESGFTF